MGFYSALRTFSGIGGLLLLTATSRAETPMDCVSEIAMPNVTGEIMTDIPATVELQILIGMDGRARKIEYGTANPRLRIVLGRYFKGKARYIPACAGKTIGFTVRYIVEGNKTQFPVSEVRFRPPKEFLVVCHPIEPSLDPFPKVPPK